VIPTALLRFNVAISCYIAKDGLPADSSHATTSAVWIRERKAKSLSMRSMLPVSSSIETRGRLLTVDPKGPARTPGEL